MIHAVIGAQYGDEGKGLLTDYLSSPFSLVVRFNGGAQAGHTVVTPEGRRHEFHHFGAGTFQGAPTLLSRFFIVNPMTFAKEYHDPVLKSVGKHVFADPRALVTTPVDMMINAALEASRGDRRHGSCGMGINETVNRSNVPGYRLTVGDLCHASSREIVRAIWYEYGPIRAAEVGVPLDQDALRSVLEPWMNDVRFFMSRVMTSIEDTALVFDSQEVVFEGAQGLRLDEHSPEYPYVTRSRTGISNVRTILTDAGRLTEPVTVHYVTRCYTTRHGAGPLKDECVGHPFEWTGPETNVENQHQGRFRYAPLDHYAVREVIETDRRRSDKLYAVPGLTVTCLDQMTGYPVPMVACRGAAKKIAETIGLPLRYFSTGPTRHDVHLG